MTIKHCYVILSVSEVSRLEGVFQVYMEISIYCGVFVEVMCSEKKYRSKALAAIHETAFDLHDAGVMDKRTLHRFGELCLTPVHPMTAEDIRTLRSREQVSQAVFALYLNVSKGVVSQWERGEKHPSGASLKLLTLVQEKGLDSIA